MVKLFFVSLSFGIGFVLTFAPLKAQPVINKIESRQGRGGQETTLRLSPGQETTLILRGTGFGKITRVEVVRFGEMDVSVIRDIVKSDEVIEVTIRIPRNARVGTTQKFAFRVSGDGFADMWLSPKPVRTAREATSNPELDDVSSPPSDPQPDDVSEPSQPQPRAVAPPSPRPAQVVILFDGRPLTAGVGAVIKFDTTTVGSPVSQTLVIHNPGQSTLRLRNLRLPHGFRQLGTFPKNVAPGDSGVITIQVAAEKDSSFSGTMLFNSNVPDQNQFALQLQATVISAPPALPSLGWLLRIGFWFILIFIIILAVTLLALKRKKSFKKTVKFKPSKDLGSAKIKSGKLIESRFELRLRPHFNHDKTRTQVDDLLISDTEDAVANPTPALS